MKRMNLATGKMFKYTGYMTILYCIFLFTCVCITSCGTSPLLESGIYDTRLTYIIDYMYQSGKTSDVKYKIDSKDQKYTLKAVGSETVFRGKEDEKR